MWLPMKPAPPVRRMESGIDNERIASMLADLGYGQAIVACRISAICYAVGRTTVVVYSVDLVGLLPIFLSSWSLGSSSTTPAFAFPFGVVTIAGTFGALMTVKGPLEMFGEPERYLE